MRLREKVAIVTGAGSRRGIGRAVALGFAREGADVIVADLDSQGAAETAKEIAGLGRHSLAVRMDVTIAAEVNKLVEDTVEQFGRIDILVNNAGVCKFVSFLDISEDLWDRTMAINVKGYFLVGQRVARQMARQGHGGKIINVSSVSAEISGEEKVHYSASKAAVKLLTQGMALELARYRINVNAVAPGDIETDIVKAEHMIRLGGDEATKDSIPWKRRGTSQDVEGAVIFLASDQAEYISGASIVVDGGLTAGSLLPAEYRSANRSL